MDLLNVTESAKYVGVTRKTIYQWEAKGKITAEMIGRIKAFSKKQLDKVKRK